MATFLLAVLAGIGWASLRCVARPWAGAAWWPLAAPGDAGAATWRPLTPPALPAGVQPPRRLPPGPILELPVLDARDPALGRATRAAGAERRSAPSRRVQTQRPATGDRRHWLRRVPGDVDDSKPTELLRGASVRAT